MDQVSEGVQTLPSNGGAITIDKFLVDGRRSFLIPREDERREAVGIILANLSNSPGSLVERLRELGVLMVDHSSNYPKYDGDYYDCRDWVFDRIGLPRYTYREGGHRADDILRGNLPELQLVAEPRPRDIVTYFRRPIYRREVFLSSHWGDRI